MAREIPDNCLTEKSRFKQIKDLKNFFLLSEMKLMNALIVCCSMRSLAEACSDGDIGTVRKLLDEGRSVHETTEEGESLLSLACSAGYYELAQVRKLIMCFLRNIL